MEKKGFPVRCRAAFLLADGRGPPAVVLVVVFDLPAAVQPPVVRGERRRRIRRARTEESERGEGR